MTADDFLVWKV